MRTHYLDIDYLESGYWVRIPRFRLPDGWGKDECPLVFQFPQTEYPQIPFYGFYVPSGLRFRNGLPKNFTDPAGANPPFSGVWAFFSGNPEPWSPLPELESGSNVLSWLHSIYARFLEGVGDD